MLDSRVGQSVNIDWTIGLAVFISVLLASLTMMMESNAIQNEVGLDTKLDQIQDNLREETELEGRRLPLIVRTPKNLSNVAFDREYVFQDSAYPGSGVMDVPAEVNISNDRIRTVIDAENSSHHVSYFFENVSNVSYSNDLDVDSDWMNNTNVSVNPGGSGLDSLRINDKELLNDSAEISGSTSITEYEVHAATLDEDLKLYNDSTELILEDPDTPIFKLENLSTLYWHSDESTTELAGTGTFKEGTTKGVTVASDYGITFVGDLDANVSKPGNKTVKVNISASRIKIRLHDSDYTEGKKRARFYENGRMTLGVAEEIKGAYREKVRDLNNLNESSFEDKLGLNGVGYNIQYGDTVETNYSVLSVLNKEDMENGEFNGTTEYKPGFQDELSMGYRNGSSGDNLTGYWRLDGDSGSVTDYSGKGNDGSNNGATRGKTGVFGTDSFEFDGSDGVAVSDVEEVRVKDPMTVTAWVNTDQLPSSAGRDLRIASKQGSKEGYVLQLNDGTDNFRAVFGQGGNWVDLKPSGTPNTDQWYMVSATLDNGEARLYINDTLAETTSYSGSFTTTSEELNIGFRDAVTDKRWDGNIDEVRIYNESMNDSEINSLYKHGTPYKGEYKSTEISNSVEKSWNDLEVNVSDLPSDTSVSANFTALDKDGNIVDDQLISLSSGLKNYSLNLQKTKDAQIIFNGTTSNVTKTWKIGSFQAYYSGNQSNDPLLDRGQELPPQNVYAVETSFPFLDRYGSFSELNSTVRVWE